MAKRNHYVIYVKIQMKASVANKSGGKHIRIIHRRSDGAILGLISICT